MSQVWLPGGGDICCGCRSRSFQAEKDVKGIQTEKAAGAKLCEGERPACLWEMGNRWGGWPKATQRGVREKVPVYGTACEGRGKYRS